MQDDTLYLYYKSTTLITIFTNVALESAKFSRKLITGYYVGPIHKLYGCYH